jgi:ketosteroid isomerase-like protein
MNRADYDRYLTAFNAKDYDGVADFYAEPMKMDFFGVSPAQSETT